MTAAAAAAASADVALGVYDGDAITPR